MIPKQVPVLAGLDVIGPDGDVYRIEKVYGRGRNRQVRLDRPPAGARWRDVKIERFRRLYHVVGRE